MTFDITSTQNPRVKHVVKLKEDKRQRRKEGLIVVEGWTEISHALAAGLLPRTIFSAPDLVSHPVKGLSSDILTVNPAVFEKMSYRENPDGWLALFEMPNRSLDDIQLGSSPLVIVAESVEKPGNLGAILRTADAAGVDALLVCDPRVDLWNPNVVRASRGALFSVPAIELNNAAAFSWLKSNAIQVLAATPSAKVTYTQANLADPVAVVVGTEDLGLTGFWLQRADQKVLIPMHGRVNSLNVSIAAALIVFEAVRQRGS
jgi:TrmH family RNA methyltransferase